MASPIHTSPCGQMGLEISPEQAMNRALFLKQDGKMRCFSDWLQSKCVFLRKLNYTCRKEYNSLWAWVFLLCPLKLFKIQCQGTSPGQGRGAPLRAWEAI